jgi:hypothetical protein
MPRDGSGFSVEFVGNAFILKIVEPHLRREILDMFVLNFDWFTRAGDSVVESIFPKLSTGRCGASTGSNEARELRDLDWPRYGDKGVLTDVKSVSDELSRALAPTPSRPHSP